MKETIFDKIIRKEIPASIVYEDEEILAFKDINPQAPIHILVIPKTQFKTINDIEQKDIELTGKLIYRASQIAKELGVAEDGYRLVFNCNKDGGQEVYHIHLHLLAGRKMTWPPG
ncbi:MAG: histidine triad nucleotide-binding protein [Candidatus Kapaibacterium sp.]|nr:histidine triad nucleotide-binding protein [Ignavibacteriota bacterium]MCB9220964.1 histidine triad nucleotide-binding protein [Ignavibacteria bacterium]